VRRKHDLAVVGAEVLGEAAARGSSLCGSSAKPAEKVFGRAPFFAASATSAAESTPPESSTPRLRF
jgi:hypothetical protein